ncbi:MAG TPA: N-acetyltransferase [Clostridiales bacterium UBA8960]|nr:N-acetyltransferase [Clostridiales bacterium UBA8960]
MTEFLSWNTHEDSQVTEGIINKWIAAYEQPNTFNWAIEVIEVGEVIGNITVVQYEKENSACEIGYCIGSKFWNKGIATEALQMVIDFLFSEIGVNRIFAKYDVLNPASGEVMKKCNMVYEGALRDEDFKNNLFCTLGIYSILKREWQQSK